MEKSSSKLDLKYLFENNKLKKTKGFGQTYGDTVIQDSLPKLQDLNDIYFLIIEKIEFSVGTYCGGSINGINLHYRNLLSNEVLTCTNTVGSHHLINNKHIFDLDYNDYITSFIVIYGIYDVMRNVEIRTKKGKKFTLPFNNHKNTERKEIVPVGTNVIVSLFYGVGGHIHNIGCYHLDEKIYMKILTIYKLVNFHYLKKLFKNKNLDDMIEHVKGVNEKKNKNERVDINDGN